MRFYPGFPIRIEHMDRKDKKTCWFQCHDHLDKYLTRNKLKISDILVEYEDPRLKPVEKPKKVSAAKPKPKKQTKQLFSSLEQFFDDTQTNVASVGKSTRRKSTQKGSRRRSNSNT
jgi:hypothetical protein